MLAMHLSTNLYGLWGGDWLPHKLVYWCAAGVHR